MTQLGSPPNMETSPAERQVPERVVTTSLSHRKTICILSIRLIRMIRGQKTIFMGRGINGLLNGIISLPGK